MSHLDITGKTISSLDEERREFPGLYSLMHETQVYKQPGEETVVFKIVSKKDDVLVSPFVNGAAVLTYPVGEWITNDTPMMAYESIRLAFQQVRNASEYRSLQLWKCRTKKVIPIRFVKSMFLSEITPTEMINIRMFWKDALETFPDNDIVFSWEKYRDVMADKGYRVNMAPAGTVGVYDLVLEELIVDNSAFTRPQRNQAYFVSPNIVLNTDYQKRQEFDRPPYSAPWVFNNDIPEY